MLARGDRWGVSSELRFGETRSAHANVLRTATCLGPRSSGRVCTALPGAGEGLPWILRM
jgi:hypothetical protein